MDIQEVVDWARREPFLALVAVVIADLTAALIWHWCTRTGSYRFLAVLLVTTVLAAIVLNRFYPQEPAAGGTTAGEQDPVQDSPEPPSATPTATELASLLERARNEEEIRVAFEALGDSRPEAIDRGGRTFCFRHRGVELLFDSADRLDKVRLFSGHQDNHQHAAYPDESLPFGLRFGMLKAEAQKQIEGSLHRKVKPELEVEAGDCDHYDLEREGLRLYLIYGEFDGERRLYEVQLLKRENLLQQQAALAR